MKRTPLYKLHLEQKAHMGEFAGWEMPIHYGSIILEHKTVREKAGVFDLCHMGRIKVEGNLSKDTLQELTTNDVSELNPGHAQYSLVCNQEGGILDDILVYCLAEREYMLVVNGVNKESILSWFHENRAGAVVSDISDEKAMIAIQGPASETILQKMTDENLSSLGYYQFTLGKIATVSTLISRTGYTGEDGFELYLDSEKVEGVWCELLEAGKDSGLQPIGLGARDTLRLEASLPLYGNELNASVNPFEANLGRFVKLDKNDFIGREALIRTRDSGVKRTLVGFEMVEKGIPRKGYRITRNGKHIGDVTSGSFSPTLNKNIGLGYIDKVDAPQGCELGIEIRGKESIARIVEMPFYRRKEEVLDVS